MDNDPLKISGMHNGAHPSVFKNAAILRERMTEPEKMLWEFLRSKPHGFKFRRQHPIGIYILDFYCHKLRFSIEIDGGYHLTSGQKEKDMERTLYLKELGITEYRVSNEEVLKKFEATIKTLTEILHSSSNPPTPNL